jgi:muconolactone delta-isomerase
VPLYLVERYLPGMTIAELAALQRAEERACAASVAQGKSVRYLRSTFSPGESRCQCLFEAPNADRVQEVNDLAQIPYSRIVLALDLPGP